MSTDGISSHLEWIHSLESVDYNGLGYQKINFPIISDVDLEVSKLYGMVEANSGRSQDIRGVFIIDPDNEIRSIYFYPATTGRNLDEVLRTLLALQTSEKNGVLTPANWDPGEQVMIPSPKTVQESQKLQSKNDPSLKMITWYMWLKTL
jgi:peroxiredoxin (alkyl hydroperoxide reductase subunit C)